MKSVFIEKSLGVDIREGSVSLTLVGKKLRTVEVLAGKTIALKPLTGKDEKAEKMEEKVEIVAERYCFACERHFTNASVLAGHKGISTIST